MKGIFLFLLQGLDVEQERFQLLTFCIKFLSSQSPSDAGVNHPGEILVFAGLLKTLAVWMAGGACLGVPCATKGWIRKELLSHLQPMRYHLPNCYLS
ncbi:MAG: hypothetical protein L6271_11760 [Desulfobacteraceae bacterium]|nr:hypothetical protein [Desulfobacteraceae bacterium]